MSLSLPQRLALVKFLDTTLAALRKDLLPQAAAEMPPGSRLPAMFGRRLAGWVTMPKPSQPSARVTSEAQLLAWATANYPEKVEHPVEVKVDAGLIEFLQEHRPESLNVATRVDPQWTADICRSLAARGLLRDPARREAHRGTRHRGTGAFPLGAQGEPGRGCRRDHRAGVGAGRHQLLRGAGTSRPAGGPRCRLGSPATTTTPSTAASTATRTSCTRSQKPGDPCLAAVVYDPPRCDCTDHRVPEAPEASGDDAYGKHPRPQPGLLRGKDREDLPPGNRPVVVKVPGMRGRRSRT